MNNKDYTTDYYLIKNSSTVGLSGFETSIARNYNDIDRHGEPCVKVEIYGQFNCDMAEITLACWNKELKTNQTLTKKGE